MAEIDANATIEQIERDDLLQRKLEEQILTCYEIVQDFFLGVLTEDQAQKHLKDWNPYPATDFDQWMEEYMKHVELADEAEN